ncbi:MAG: flagellin [Thiomicrorhabdus sp.]|nr:MAG: flagellin [Thiomicrorhabdus sp.]
MAMVINTNMGAVNANRILDATSKEQALSMEKLTSGKSINKAADNAAGLAIATGMTSQIMGTDQSIKNANDGISMIQTVDGATNEVVDMIQRMRELAVQSLNGTYSASNRSQMDEEYTQLELEINRVATTTKFNETALMAKLSTNGSMLSGAVSTVNLHVGWEAGADNKIDVSMVNFAVGYSGGNHVLGQFTNLAGSVINSAFDSRSISTQAAASTAVQHIDGALSNIVTQRAKWGALQNRLESSVSNLSSINENMTAARSRIEDTDFARESANLARTQVLQQAGMSMLSQANQSSENVLSLLR